MFRIGARYPGGGGAIDDWEGNMDQFLMWDRILTPSEVTILYNDGVGIENPLDRVVLNYPLDDSTLIDENITFNSTIFGDLLINSTLFLWNSSSDLINETTQIRTGDFNTSSIIINGLSIGNYIWNYYVCDSINCSFAPSNFTFDWGYVINNFEFNTPVLETSNQRFATNLTVASGITVTSATLIYNGTTFSGATKSNTVDDNWTLSININIPQGLQGFSSETRDFTWNITYNDISSGVLFTSETNSNTQTVNEIDFGTCTVARNISMLNFTMKDEITGLDINGVTNATTFQATFQIATLGSNNFKNFSVNNLSVSQHEFDFCTSGVDNEFKINMDLFYTAVDYSDKDYFLNNATINNITSEIDLFLLPDDDSIQFFITVEKDFFRVPNAIVQISKFFIGEGIFKTVEIDTTDSNGELTANLELNKDYRFTIIVNGQVEAIILKSSICQAAPCTILLDYVSPSPSADPLLPDFFAQNVAFNLSFNPITKIVTFEFSDTTGLATSFTMEIVKFSANQSGEIINSQTVFTSSGSMTFNATTSPDGSYRVNVFISRSPSTFLDFLTYILSEFTEAVGIDGLLVGLLFLSIVVVAFIVTPSAGVLAIPICLSILRIMGFTFLTNTQLSVIWGLAILTVYTLTK